MADVYLGINKDTKNKLPLGLGIVTIEKCNNTRFRVMYNYSSISSAGQLYIASVDTIDMVVNGWYQISVTAV